MDRPTRLPFIVTTGRGVRELELRLHEHTSSPEHVGELISRLLDAVTEFVDGPREVSDGDVIQALTLTMAVRLDTAGVPAPTAHTLVSQLVGLALESTGSTSPGAAPRH